MGGRIQADLSVVYSCSRVTSPTSWMRFEKRADIFYFKGQARTNLTHLACWSNSATIQPLLSQAVRWLWILGCTFVHQVFSLVADAGKGAPRIASTWSKVISIFFAAGGCLRNHSSKGRYLLNSGCLAIEVSSKIVF